MTISSDSKRSIAIMLPALDSIRNVVYSGLLERLNRSGVDVHLLIYDYNPSVPDAKNGQGFSLAKSCQPLIAPTVKHIVRGLAMLKSVLASAYGRRYGIGSYAIYRRWHDRDLSKWERLRRRGIEILGTLAQPHLIYTGLVRLFDRLYRRQNDLSSIRQQLQEVNPDLLCSTYYVMEPYERGYIDCAKDLGIPVINEIMSFDNLTSKTNHMVYDYYLVWNQGMQDQLLRFYPQVKPNQISITGTPQFDFHLRQDCNWKRDETLERLGLPPGAKYFLYAAGSASLTPAEPALVTRLAERMQANDLLHGYWLVVRLHPRDDWSRWEPVRSVSNRLVLSKPWGAESGVVYPAMADQARLTSSLAHAKACINIASTVSLDAAILDRPVIGIRFDQEPDAPREILYEEFDTDHYRPLVESGGLRLAYTWEDLFILMIEAIKNPERDKEERLHMVSKECGMVDGKAAERVACALLGYLEKVHL